MLKFISICQQIAVNSSVMKSVVTPLPYFYKDNLFLMVTTYNSTIQDTTITKIHSIVSFRFMSKYSFIRASMRSQRVVSEKV